MFVAHAIYLHSFYASLPRLLGILLYLIQAFLILSIRTYVRKPGEVLTILFGKKKKKKSA